MMSINDVTSDSVLVQKWSLFHQVDHLISQNLLFVRQLKCVHRLVCDCLGTSQKGFAELSRPGDKYTGQELVSVLRLNKTKTLQLLAINKMGKGKFGLFCKKYGYISNTDVSFAVVF